jgi:hypothetical protein
MIGDHIDIEKGGSKPAATETKAMLYVRVYVGDMTGKYLFSVEFAEVAAAHFWIACRRAICPCAFCLYLRHCLRRSSFQNVSRGRMQIVGDILRVNVMEM